MAAINLSDLLNKFTSQYEQTRKESEQRKATGLSELAEAAGLFGPGYGAGAKQQALAQMGQSMVGRGLAGTTRTTAGAGGIEAYFENLRRGKLAEALKRTAEYQRTFPDVYPEAGEIAHLATGGYRGLLSKEALELQQLKAQTEAQQPGGLQVNYPEEGGLGGDMSDIGSPDFTLPSISGGAGGQLQPRQGSLTAQQKQYAQPTSLSAEKGLPGFEEFRRMNPEYIETRPGMYWGQGMWAP